LHSIISSLVAVEDAPALALPELKRAYRIANVAYQPADHTSQQCTRNCGRRVLSIGEFVQAGDKIGLVDHILRHGRHEWVRVTYLTERSKLAAPRSDVTVLELTREVEYFPHSVDFGAVHVVHDCMTMSEDSTPCALEIRERAQRASARVLKDAFRGHNRTHNHFLLNPWFV
jgi:hypothetical protein